MTTKTTLRQDYSPKEKAFYFKKLQDFGLSLRGIARECDYDENAVVAHLNVLKLPEKYQNLIWDGPLAVSHIQELRPLFEGGAVRTARILKWLDQIIAQKLTRDELRASLRPELKEIEEKRVEVAIESVPEVMPEVKVPETSEEFEEAAKVLRTRAKELKTPKQIHQENLEKAQKALNRISFSDAERFGVDVRNYRERVAEIEDYIKDRPLEALKDIKILQGELNSEVNSAQERFEGFTEKEVEFTPIP